MHFSERLLDHYSLLSLAAPPTPSPLPPPQHKSCICKATREPKEAKTKRHALSYLIERKTAYWFVSERFNLQHHFISLRNQHSRCLASPDPGSGQHMHDCGGISVGRHGCSLCSHFPMPDYVLSYCLPSRLY